MFSRRGDQACERLVECRRARLEFRGNLASFPAVEIADERCTFECRSEGRFQSAVQDGVAGIIFEIGN